MPKAEGSSAQSIAAVFLDNYEQREQESYQAFSAYV